MGLFLNVLDEARAKGIDIAPKIHPSGGLRQAGGGEEPGVFHDASFIEVKPHVTKDKKGVMQRETLTEHWTDWIDYWSVDFDYENKREIVRVPKQWDEQGVIKGLEGEQPDLDEWEERWTGDYIFENEWQSYRTKKDRSLELTGVAHEVTPGRRKIAVKVVDIFGNDTMTIVEVNV